MTQTHETPRTSDAQTPGPGSQGRLSRPVHIALTAVGLASAALLALWLVRSTPWTSSDDEGQPGDNGIAELGLTRYPAGERQPAPPLEGRTLEGTEFNLHDLEGQLVVINVWGSWCGPCRAETPGLVRIANATAGRGVRFIGIDTRDSLAGAKAFVKNYKVPYPSVFDATGQALLPFRDVIPSAAIPSSVVLDRDGNVAARVIGTVDETTLTGLLADLRAEGNRTDSSGAASSDEGGS